MGISSGFQFFFSFLFFFFFFFFFYLNNSNAHYASPAENLCLQRKRKLCTFHIFGARLSVFVLLCKYDFGKFEEEKNVYSHRVLERTGRVPVNITFFFVLMQMLSSLLKIFLYKIKVAQSQRQPLDINDC